MNRDADKITPTFHREGGVVSLNPKAPINSQQHKSGNHFSASVLMPVLQTLIYFSGVKEHNVLAGDWMRPPTRLGSIR